MNDEQNALRKIFFESWKKHLNKLPLEPVEAQLVDVILWHPEYHEFFTDSDNLEISELNGANPFLHVN